LAIHRFLLDIFHQPSPGEFQAQLDEPSYEPTDRLLIKRRGCIIAHIRTINREMRFGSQTLPIAHVSDLGTLPEHRGRGCGSALLGEAESRVRRDGAMLGLLRTNAPQFYQKRGWLVCGHHSYSMAGPRHILSHLSEVESSCRLPLHSKPPRLHIRFWRHVEQAALVRLYEECTQDTFGPCVRSEPYWRWLVGRRAYDRIYVAIEGSPRLELDDTLLPIVGYAFMRNGRIVELMTSGRRADAARCLLARACGDAIENDLHEIRLDAAPDHPLHQTIAAAGGINRCWEEDHEDVVMVKVFDTARLVSALRNQFRKRVLASRLSLPCELGFLIDDERYVLEITSRKSKLASGKIGRSYVECSAAEFVRLLMGDLDVNEATERGQIVPSTRLALETAGVLLPRLPLWYPPLDDLLA
jgi:predicted acetyltransferase